MEFDGTQVLIGRGAQADVYMYQGYAYKVYNASYPKEWIMFEKMQQSAVNNAGLSSVRYYDTDDEHIIKMDLVEGEALERKVKEGYLEGFDILAEAFRRVHAVDIDGISIPRFIDTAGMGLTQEEKDIVLPIIERFTEKMPSCICHLDMHFLNIMLNKDGNDFTLVDWMNARVAPPIFDYARTYVIFDEFAKVALPFYEKAVVEDIKKLNITEDDLKEAVKVCRIIRKHERE